MKLSVTHLRRLSQAWCVGVVLLAAWEFGLFVEALRAGGAELPRPPVVEGFLPVAAVTALRAFAATGVFDPVHPAGLVVLLAALAGSWLFRRAFCSWVCPVGALSEALWKAGSYLPRRPKGLPRWLDGVFLALKFAVFGVVVKYFFLMPGEQAVGFLRLPYYAVSDIKMYDFFVNIGLIGLGVILSILLLTVLFRSFWCRELCPYGAVLGVLGAASPIVLRKNPDQCTGCGVCDKGCPGRVRIAARKKIVVTAECTGCGTCVENCPEEGALAFRFLGLIPVRPVVFGLLFLALFFGAILAAKGAGRWQGSLRFDEIRRVDRMMGR